ncbi:MAG TPA: primosomal protein N' [Clostridia bacterium]|nr:primosomal protein N' [Clostridia bacterium]
MEHRAAYAQVVVEIADRKVDRPFHYYIPPELKEAVQPGVRVLVPFGHRQLEGYVIGLADQADVSEVKPILAVVEGELSIQPELLRLARWMAVYYMCPLVTVLQAFFPRGKRTKQKELWCYLEPSATVEQLGLAKKRAPKQGAIIDILQQFGSLPVGQVLKLADADRRSLMSLVDKGVVVIREAEAAAPAQEEVPEKPPRLTAAQARVMEEIRPKLVPPQYEVFLLHGVTGSGKTEIYLQSLAQAVEAGYQGIVLFPEISLTTHLVERFYRRFGRQVAVLHSGLSVGERLATLDRISSGQVPVVVGTRSAVFAPAPKLGLIILDEEHETSYRQEAVPKYHAREVAIARAFIHKIPVILGSATPSLESYHRARQGKYKLLVMEERVEQKHLPQVLVTDMRSELKEGNASVFGKLLQEKLQERLESKEQAILFLNRRGYANLFHCRDCGQVIKCARCDVSLTYYAKQHCLKCHYCGYVRPVPAACPVCGSSRVRPLGAGTEKVEQELRRLFPEAKVVRLDSDTVGRKGDYYRLWEMFQRREADVMIGTQMVAKGLDFPGVTLVGVILADQMLNFPDFRARERTFQLLTQVAGRAGRGSRPGEVVIQTYVPEDPTIQAVVRHNYREFFAQEVHLRQLLNYPPFSHILRILVLGPDEEMCETGSKEIADQINYYRGAVDVTLFGPAPAPVTKINNVYRWQLLLKGLDLKKMRHLVGASLREVATKGRLPRGLRINLDVDPLGML